MLFSKILCTLTNINYNPCHFFLEKCLIWPRLLATVLRLSMCVCVCVCACICEAVCMCVFSLIGSFYCINVSNGSTLFNNAGSSFLCPSSPSHHVWSDSHVSHHSTQSTQSTVGDLDTERGTQTKTLSLEYNLEICTKEENN